MRLSELTESINQAVRARDRKPVKQPAGTTRNPTRGKMVGEDSAGSPEQSIEHAVGMLVDISKSSLSFYVGPNNFDMNVADINDGSEIAVSGQVKPKEKIAHAQPYANNLIRALREIRSEVGHAFGVSLPLFSEGLTTNNIRNNKFYRERMNTEFALNDHASVQMVIELARGGKRLVGWKINFTVVADNEVNDRLSKQWAGRTEVDEESKTSMRRPTSSWFMDEIIGVDAAKKKGDVFRVARSFFYRGNMSPEKYVKDISAALDKKNIEYKIIDSGEVYGTPFKGGASVWRQDHFWVDLKILSDRVPYFVEEGLDEQTLQERDPNPASDKKYEFVSKYEQYEIYVTRFKDKFLAVAYNSSSSSRFAAATGENRPQAVENLKAEISKVKAKMPKVTGKATVDFNVKFSQEFLDDPTDSFWIKLAQGPSLVFPSRDYEGNEDMLRADGFKKAMVRSSRDSEAATPIHAVPLSPREVQGLDLVANGRYVVTDSVSTDRDGNRVYQLEFHSEVASSDDRQRLNKPALTVASQRG
jgi:hypothetical protein